MSMPRDLVLVRHGQSEANIIQKQVKDDPSAKAPEGFHNRHDSLMRLSRLGVSQAITTGDWIRREFPEGFDRYFVSPHNRAVETAGRMAIGGVWSIDDRWRERDWGEFGILNDEERQERFALSTLLKTQSKWYWRPAGGESLATEVRLRFEDILDTLHRELDGKRAIAVTHGETMEVARFVIERLLPNEWAEQEEDSNFKISNCQVLHYSRVNPNNGEIGDRIEWRRSVCAWDDERSWSDGEWVHLPPRKFSDEDLLTMVEGYPQLLES